MFARLGGRRQLAIDWDAQSLRIVQFRSRAGRIDIVKAVSVPIPADVRLDDAESLGAFLRQALDQARIRDRRAALAIPREKVVLNTLSVPPSPLDELPAVVQFQIQKELPYAAEQATIDFTVHGAFDPKAPAELLVAAVRNEVIEFQRALAKEAGLAIERVGLRPHANLVAFSAGAEQVQRGLCLAIDVGPALTEINVLRDGGLVFSRSASVRVDGGADAAAGPEVLDSRIVGRSVSDLDSQTAAAQDAVAALMVELTRSIEAYRATDPAAHLDRIIVAGATGVEALLAEALHARLNVHAELYNPGVALDLPPQRARELRGFSAAIGLALAYQAVGPQQFNFLSPKRAVAPRTRQLRRVPTAVIAAGVVVAAYLVFRTYALQPRLEKIESLRADVKELREVVEGRKSGKLKYEGVRDLEQRADAATQWFRNQHIWTAHLAALSKALPSDKDAYVTQINFNNEPPAIDLSLRTKQPSVTAALVERLTAAGYNVSVGTSSESQLKDGFQFTDSLRIVLPPAGAMRVTGGERPTATQGARAS